MRVFTWRATERDYQRVKAAAKANGRSLNAELVSRLEWTLWQDGMVP